jgi:two-component system, LytTR family, response regulator
MDKSLKKYACLVADDEPQARSIIEAYIQELPYLECVATCKNAFEVLTALQNMTIDILFLDIKMPNLTGLNMVKCLEKRPKIVFTTAYSEHAIEAFDLGVVDYLLKPISFERFLKAVNRCMDAANNSFATPSVFEPISNDILRKEDDFIFLKTDRTFIKILLKDICYVEAYGNYSKVHLIDKMHVVSEKISTICDNLDNAEFLRVHKSFIVSLSKIEQLEHNLIRLKNAKISLSDTYKKAFIEAFRGRFNN